MYTLYSDVVGRSLHGTTLEELREKLVNSHLANRRDPQFGDFIDQAHAVHPLDESELDEGETQPAPRPLTEDLLIRFARYIWDTPHVKLEDTTTPTTTTLHALATTLHYLWGMDIDIARATLRNHIELHEKHTGKSIDENNIYRRDADFLISSIKTARAAGELCEIEMAELATATAAYQDVQATADALRTRRDTAINAAVSAGASKAAVARVAGISKQAVAKVLRRA